MHGVIASQGLTDSESCCRFFFFQAEDGIRDSSVTGVQTCALPISAVGAVASAAIYHYGEHSWRFRLQSSDDIELAGLSNVTHAEVMEERGGDLGRKIFIIPMDQRQKQLEQIPWLESASVMRFAPNRIKIQIHERTPVAFARVGSKVLLIDAGGTLMDLSSKKRYSFPVIVGMNSGEPLSTRAARIKIYNDLARDLDSGGGHYSQDLSEVDLSDAEDVKVITNHPGGEVLVHLGSSNYLDRFKIYVAHLREWRQQFDKLESVDLRYDRQIIVNPDLRGAERQPALTAAMTRAAIAAGVKPTALVTREPAKSSAPKAVAVQTAANKRSTSPTLPQKARKNGAPAVIPVKKPTKQAHWRKRPIMARHATVKPVTKPAAAACTPQYAPVAQKPSPAVTN